MWRINASIFKEFFKATIKRVRFRIHSRNVKREMFRQIIKAIMQGRTDYECSSLPLPKGRKNMLPKTNGKINNKILFSLDVPGGKSYIKWWFSSLDVKIDSLRLV